MSENLRIIPEGVTQAPTISAAERTPIQLAKISQSAKLGDLKEYAWFTPALLYMYVPLTRDPLADFQVEHQLELQVFSFRFEKPIFRGLDVRNDSQWNHVLYGVEADKCEQLLEHLGTVGFMFNNVEPAVLCRLRTQPLEIIDPLVIDRGRTISLPADAVSITALCLDTSRGCYYFRTQGDRLPGDFRPRLLPHHRPRAVFSDKPFDDTVKLTKALRSGHARPYDAVLPEAAPELQQRVAAEQQEKDSHVSGDRHSA